MGEPGNFRKSLAALSAFLFRVYIEIWGPSAVAAVIGVLTDIPLFYLFATLMFIYAMTMTGLVKYVDWREKTTARYKLSYRECRFGFLHDEAGNVTSVQLGFDLRNRAKFPIRVEIENLYTSLSDRHPPKKETINGKTVPAKSTVSFDDHPIDLEDLQLRFMTAEGVIKASVRYGKSDGELTEVLHINKQIFLYFNEDGQYDSIRIADAE